MATDDKYDRQLRLWGAHGQAELMAAKVCCIGSTAVASETLKNLVLPGIGFFTIVDDAVVDEADCGQNFFVRHEDLGRPRAEVTKELLLELNPDVKGSHLVQSVQQFIAGGEASVAPFTLVIATQLSEQQALPLSRSCRQRGIPFLSVDCFGFLGKLRLLATDHQVIETKPDSDFGDLRMQCPFPELQAMADSIDLASLPDAGHAHVPYVIILLQALKEMQPKCTGGLPSTKEEKEQFKALVRGWSRGDTEVNFEEAIDNAYKAWSPYSIPDGVREVLDAASGKVAAAGAAATDFWVVARAIALFTEQSGKLPLAGTIPDMTSDSDSYVNLQSIYIEKARKDAGAVTEHVKAVLKEIGSGRDLPTEMIERFCKNSQYAEVFNHRSLDQELSEEPMTDDIACELADDESQAAWYLGFRAADRFLAENKRRAGDEIKDEDAAAMASDIAGLMVAAKKVCQEMKFEDGVEVPAKVLEELARYGSAELHSTASILGGVASQEAVKLVTRQFAPLNNTFVYNGLEGRGQVLEV